MLRSFEAHLFRAHLLVGITACTMLGCIDLGPIDTGSASKSLVATPKSQFVIAQQPTKVVFPAEVAPPVDAPKPGEFVVHEWGTFTSVQALDGTTLEGLHHEDEELPYFVYGRADFAHFVGHGKSMEVMPEPVTQKMETPVIYFYSDVKRDVQVKVDFPQGFISQWYPAMASFSPELYGASKIAGGSMTWNVTVDPDIDISRVEAVDPDDIWAPSREVAATPIEVAGEVEHFIFYRGVGRFELPIRMTTKGDNASVLNNSFDDVPRVFLLNVTETGGQVVDLGSVVAGQALTHPIPAASLSISVYKEKARNLLAEALEKTGLYKDEAWSMVNTWSHSYFETPGLRILYVLPRSWTEALLPIEIVPQPDRLERTLVGRIESITQAQEERARAEIFELASSDISLHKASDQLFIRLGRFAEPIARRACALIKKAACYTKEANYCKQLLPRMHANYDF